MEKLTFQHVIPEELRKPQCLEHKSRKNAPWVVTEEKRIIENFWKGLYRMLKRSYKGKIRASMWCTFCATYFGRSRQRWRARLSLKHWGQTRKKKTSRIQNQGAASRKSCKAEARRRAASEYSDAYNVGAQLRSRLDIGYWWETAIENNYDV